MINHSGRIVSYIGSTAEPRLLLSSDMLGAPGVRKMMIVLAQKENEARQDAVRLQDISEREFFIEATLAKYPSVDNHINGRLTADDGASHITISNDQASLLIYTSYGKFRALKNKHNELSMLDLTVNAISSFDARARFLNIVTPWIDHTSYLNNVPIFISAISMHDVPNDVQYVDFVAPYRSVSMQDHISGIDTNMMPIYAMYREARNAESPYYQLLCYYKIMDGIQYLRAQAVNAARKRNLQIKMPDELVPNHEELSPDLLPYAGKSIQAFKDGFLTRRYRDAVAHFISKDKKVLHVSSPSETIGFANAVFACELCVRVQISNQEQLIVQINSK